MSIRVVVVDDQDLVRTGLVMIVNAHPDFEVVGEAADGLAAIELVTRLRPDVLLIDIRMPGLDGVEVTRRLAGPGVADPVAVVVITTFDSDDYVLGAVRAGARGFLLKDAGPALLIQAIQAAADGEALIAPSVTPRLLATLVDRAPGPVSQPVDRLTPREEEVCRTRLHRARLAVRILDHRRARSLREAFQTRQALCCQYGRPGQMEELQPN